MGLSNLSLDAANYIYKRFKLAVDNIRNSKNQTCMLRGLPLSKMIILVFIKAVTVILDIFNILQVLLV